MIRATAALSVCALVLAGCETLNESAKNFNQSVKQVQGLIFSDDDAPEAAAEGAAGNDAVTAEFGDEVALDPAVVTKVQGQLRSLGYEPGPVDGAMGPKTRAAIRRYQVVVGMPVDGRISEAFMARLEESVETEQSTASGGATAENSQSTQSLAAAGDSEPAPVYEVGNQYVYTDGDVRTVDEVDGEEIHWRSNKSGHSVAYRNFLIPSLSWVSPDSRGKRVVDAAPDEVWPQDGGAETTFSAMAMVEHRMRPDSRSKTSETWRCRLEEESRVTVEAGQFETQQLVCDLLSDPEGTHLRRIWHYAPEIRHYVLFEEFDGAEEPRRHRELLAIVPSTTDWPPAARAGLGWALSHALETAPPGEETEWTSSAVDTQVTIKPGPEADAGQDKTCRTFVQTWSGPEGERIYPGLSCREAPGEWLIPGLEAGVELAGSSE